MSEGDTTAGYWPRTRRLMFVTMAVWAVLGFVLPFAGTMVNHIVILGFPLGFHLSAQGVLIGFVVLIFWFSRKQEQLDATFTGTQDK